MEVPFVHTDAVHWAQVRVPSDYDAAGAFCPPAEDCAGGVERTCNEAVPGFSHSNATIVWRIHRARQTELELLGLSASEDLHERGIRLVFEDALSPFVVITPCQVATSQGAVYQVLALTVSGILYMLKLGISSVKGLYVQESGIVEHDLSNHLMRLQQVTSITAAPGVLCIGCQNGSVLCVPLNNQLKDGQDNVYELRDGDAGLSRLWGFVTRGKTAGPVTGLAARLVNGTPTLFALHEDGVLRTWDLLHRTRLLQHVISPSDTPGFVAQMMWFEEPPSSTASLKFAVLYSLKDEERMRQTIVVCSLNRAQGDVGNRLSNLVSQHVFPIDQGKVRDFKIVNGRLWILRGAENGASRIPKVYCASLKMDGEGVQTCFLQEADIRDHLLQGPGHTWDDTLFAAHQLRADALGLSGVTVAGIFLRRLCQPGVLQYSSLREAMSMRGRQMDDFQLQSLSQENLKKEIASAVQSEVSGENSARVLQEWMQFGQDYVTVWCHNSSPYGLLSDAATGVVGLIRRNSISFMRSLTGVEQHIHGGLVEVEGVPLSSEWEEAQDSAVLAGVLRCTETIGRHLGRLALAAFHEALLRPLDNSFHSLTTTYMSILDVGYSPKILRNDNPYVGLDEARDKERDHHLRHRKFSLNICQSLQALHEKAGSWEDVIDIIEKYAAFLITGFKSPVPGKASQASVGGSFYKKILAQMACQVAVVHFQAARNLLLLLSYMVKVRWQVGLTPNEVSKIQLGVIPQVQEALTVGLLLHWLTITSTEAPPPEDFSSQLSSLRIDGPAGNGALVARKAVCQNTLADILASAYVEHVDLEQIASAQVLPPSEVLLCHAIHFVSWLLWGNSKDSPATFSGRAIMLSWILLQHGQHAVLENFIISVEQFSSQQKLADNIESMDGEWSARVHLLGVSLLSRACSGSQDTAQKQIEEAVCCFFRAASGIGEANKVLPALLVGAGQEQTLPARNSSTAALKLDYFEGVMQIFERYKFNEGARRFAHAALEQVDAAIGTPSDKEMLDTIKGRLWANVFKFSLDLELYEDAYCAIVSNPDGESKQTCLRRFIVVLCEKKAVEVLCGQELPYVGLLEQVEQELTWKAENSGIYSRPNPYKLLYAFNMHRHNWRRAAAHMYRYALRMRSEGISKSKAQASSFLQEQLNGIAAAMNALQLVGESHAWIECSSFSSTSLDWASPTKRPRIMSGSPGSSPDVVKSAPRRIVDLKQLEKEYAITFAKKQLVDAEISTPIPGDNASPAEIVHLLVELGLYETAFSLLFLFWKDSSLQRELETVFQTMARKCCSLQLQEASPSSTQALAYKPSRLLLANAPSTEKSDIDELITKLPATSTAKTAWQALQSYLTRYNKEYPHLAVAVAETILSSHNHMELPLWLVDIFRGGRHASPYGMAGQSADPAALLRIYLEFDCIAEATTFLLEFLQAWANLRPADIMRRKRTSAVWFPYMLIDRLQTRLSELASSDRPDMQNLQASLDAVLQKHFDQIKVDSEDVLSLAQANGVAAH